MTPTPTLPVMDLRPHPYLDSPAPRYLSLGAGIDSTTLGLMGVDGILPKYDGAIFADTGWEPRPVYEHLRRLAPVLEAAGIPVHIVSVGNIRDDALSADHRFASMPLFTQEEPWTCDACNATGRVPWEHYRPGIDDEDNEFDDCPECGGAGWSDGKGMVRRQCTSEYKLKPIKAKIRHLLGAPRLEGDRIGRVPGKPGLRHAWNVVGIAAEEVGRIKPADVLYLRRVDPLVDLLEPAWSRDDCEAWLADRWPWPVPRSACVGCPFHTNLEWRTMRDNDPESWADAVAFDHALRAPDAGVNMPHLRGAAYLHNDRVPLDEANIDKISAAERKADQGNLFGGTPGCSPWGCERSAPVPIELVLRRRHAALTAATP